MKKEYYILGAILVFAFFLRIYSLGTPAFWLDESISSMASLNIIEKGLPVFDSGVLFVLHFALFWMIFYGWMKG